MNYSRRNFVKLGGIAAIASLGLPNLTFGQKAKDFFAVQTTESLQQFIGAEFYIASDDVSTVVTLTAVKDFPHKTKTGKCFSMEFHVFLKCIKDDSYLFFVI